MSGVIKATKKSDGADKTIEVTGDAVVMETGNLKGKVWVQGRELDETYELECTGTGSDGGKYILVSDMIVQG